MKKYLIAGLFVLGMMSLATTQVKTEESESSVKAANAANGAKLWSQNCNRCHEMRSLNDFTKRQWFVAAQHMRVRAGLTGQDVRDIVAFLQGSASN